MDLRPQDSSFWARVAVFVADHPRIFFLSSLSFLVAWAAYFLATVRFGIVDAVSLSPLFDSRQVDIALKSDFSLLGISRAHVFLQTGPGTSVTDPSFLSALDVFVSQVKLIPHVTNVYSMLSTGRPGLSLSSYQSMYASYANNTMPPAQTATLSKLWHPMLLTDFHATTYVDVSLDAEKCSSVAFTAVRRLRALMRDNSNAGAFPPDMLAYAGVGGDPAVCLDLIVDARTSAPLWLGILFGGTFLVLLALTRSILIPLKAITVAAMTILASLGILLRIFPNQTDSNVMSALAFQPDGFIDVDTVVFITSVSFGLGVDYEVFVIAKMMEEYKSCKDNRTAIIRAISSTGKVITAAAFMLGIVVFAFIGAKVLLLQEIGVGIAVGVFLDAFVVRIFLVPSFLLLLGEEITWYCPQWLLMLLDLVGLGESSEIKLDDLDAEHAALVLHSMTTSPPQGE